MTTIQAAESLGIGDRTGSLEVGKVADLVIINDPSGNDIQDIGAIGERDILAVITDGNLVAGQSGAMTGDGLKDHCPYVLGGKFICVDFSRYNFTFDDLIAKNANNVDPLSTSNEAECGY